MHHLLSGLFGRDRVKRVQIEIIEAGNTTQFLIICRMMRGFIEMVLGLVLRVDGRD